MLMTGSKKLQSVVPEGVTVEFRRYLAGFGLTTANILYRLPDHPGILQTFIWQQQDISPDFPELARFLDFWTRELDGLLHSVTIAHAGLIRRSDWGAPGFEGYLYN